MNEKVIYTKFSNDRMKKYSIATEIIQREDGRVVRKRAMTREAAAHIKFLKAAQESLKTICQNSLFQINAIVGEGEDYVDFEYVDGTGFEAVLDQLIEKKDYESFREAIEKFFGELDKIGTVPFAPNETFYEYFGNDAELEKLEGMPSCAVSNVDMIFQNLIIDARGTWNIIDYEWTLDCTLPVDFIKYRALFLYMYGLGKRAYLIRENLYEKFGLNTELSDVYAMMERNFQNAIKGEYKQFGDYYKLIRKPVYNMPAVIEKEKREREENEIRVYYDDGEDFSEENSRVFAESPVIVPVYEELKTLRVDPMPKKGLVKIWKVTDENGKDIPYWTNGILTEDSVYYFDHEDPAVFIKLQEERPKSITVEFDAEPTEKYADGIIKKIYHTPENPGKEAEHSVPMAGKKALKKAYKGLRYLKRNGLKATIVRMKNQGNPYAGAGSVYEREILSQEELNRQRAVVFEKAPQISILVPLYNTPIPFLREMIDSVLEQTYANWQLCLADGSDEAHDNVGQVCQEYCSGDGRITYRHLEQNGGISENTNECIKLAAGEYIALFDHDDLLSPNALYEIVKRINERDDADVLYTDEDKIMYDESAKANVYLEPHFKSDFNLDLFRSNNYICHFFVVKKEIVEEVRGFRKEYDGSQDYDFIFRCVELARAVEHIPKVLYHWRIHANSTAANPASKMYCYEAGKKAIESHLERKGIRAFVEMREHLGFYRVKYAVQNEDLVSIVILNKDEKETLEQCINSILQKTTYKNYEILIAENNSKTQEIFAYYNEIEENKKIRVLYWKDEFNYSKINNFAVRHAKGKYIVLLNNDIEVLTGNWIEEMLSNCQREEIGIVGAKLIYPNDTIQHAGVIIGMGGIAGHAFVGLDRNHPGYFGRAIVQQNYNAVTAACLMVSRKLYDEVGGLEEDLKVAFNDVDFCLKVRKKGYLVTWLPDVEMYHYESKSRGMDDTEEKKKRFQSEIDYMAKKWRGILTEGDCYYNPNLSLIGGDFSIRRKDEIVPKYI